MTLPDTLYLSGSQYHTATAPRFVGWRCKHVPEPGAHQTPEGMPEIRPSVNARPVQMTDAMKEMSWQLMSQNNSNVTRETWGAVFQLGKAFCNHEAWTLEKALICGGMFIHGEVSRGNLICVPGYDAIDAGAPMPTVEEVIERNWYFSAVGWSGRLVTNFPEGRGMPVLVPYILREPVSYPLAWFERWERDELPDPLTIYNAR